MLRSALAGQWAAAALMAAGTLTTALPVLLPRALGPRYTR
jgi:hypothetical protein